MTVVLTLALGVGAATSVFSVVHAVLLKPLAFREPDRLVVVREVQNAQHSGEEVTPFNYRHFLRLKKTAKTLEDMAVFQNRSHSVSPVGEHPHMVGSLESSPSLLPMLDVRPILGRGFTESDATPGAQPVMLLSYNAWQTMFGGRADVVGQMLRLGGEPVTIIGVLSAGLRFPQLALAPKIEFARPAATREVRLPAHGATSGNALGRHGDAQLQGDGAAEGWRDADLPVHLVGIESTLKFHKAAESPVLVFLLPGKRASLHEIDRHTSSMERSAFECNRRISYRVLLVRAIAKQFTKSVKRILV